jgi:hypothetical protein
MKKKILFALIGLLLLVVSLNATTRVCYSLFFANEYFVLFPLLVISAITSITLSIVDYKHKTRYRIIHILIFLSIGIGLLGGHMISAVQNKTAIANLKNIVTAINKYKKSNKSYPHELNELMPKFLESIPIHIAG